MPDLSDPPPYDQDPGPCHDPGSGPDIDIDDLDFAPHAPAAPAPPARPGRGFMSGPETVPGRLADRGPVKFKHLDQDRARFQDPTYQRLLQVREFLAHSMLTGRLMVEGQTRATVLGPVERLRAAKELTVTCVKIVDLFGIDVGDDDSATDTAAVVEAGRRAVTGAYFGSHAPVHEAADGDSEPVADPVTS